jgi:hypothetical protein
MRAVHETNDFYRLLDWKPVPYRMTWWLDANGKITGAMVHSLPGKPTSRLPEFREWAAAHHPEELEYLMPKRPPRPPPVKLKWRAERAHKPAPTAPPPNEPRSVATPFGTGGAEGTLSLSR